MCRLFASLYDVSSLAFPGKVALVKEALSSIGFSFIWLKVKKKSKQANLLSEKTEKYRHVLLTTAGPKEKQRLQKPVHSARYS